MPFRLQHAPLLGTPYDRGPAWDAVDTGGRGPPWTPLARDVTLDADLTADAAAERDARWREGLARTAELRRDRRFPKPPTAPPSSAVDVVAWDRRWGDGGDSLYLVMLVHDDPVAAAYAGLRVWHASAVWGAAHRRDPEGLSRGLATLLSASVDDWVRGRSLSADRPIELVPVVAFDAPPALRLLRRTSALLHALAAHDPGGLLDATEFWAWPFGGSAFRIPSRAIDATHRRRKCPSCGSPYVVPIVRGMPTDEAVAAAGRGDLVLAGCLVGWNDPNWRCRGCEADW